MRVFVVVALIIMLVPVVAQADINYSGETTTIGANNLWDYDYWMDAGPFAPLTTPRWGIVCPVNPVSITAPDGWTYQWYASIPANLPTLDAIWAQPGIVWTTVFGSEYVLTGFHFQTNPQFSPVQQPYDGDGTSWTGVTQYSANPEPASLVLLGLVMAGGNFWRRRRNRR